MSRVFSARFQDYLANARRVANRASSELRSVTEQALNVMNIQEPALLDLQNVSVMRGQKVVLENFQPSDSGNEHVAILGPNGCGKSTLIKTITRECYPVAQEGPR